MTRREIVKTMRADMDRLNPHWRQVVRAQMNADTPGWVAWTVAVPRVNRKPVKVALLANPERVPDPSEIDPATDPFASADFAPPTTGRPE